MDRVGLGAWGSRGDSQDELLFNVTSQLEEFFVAGNYIEITLWTEVLVHISSSGHYIMSLFHPLDIQLGYFLKGPILVIIKANKKNTHTQILQSRVQFNQLIVPYWHDIWVLSMSTLILVYCLYVQKTYMYILLYSVHFIVLYTFFTYHVLEFSYFIM